MFLRSSDLIMRMVHNVIAKLSHYELFSIDVQRYRFPVGSLRWLKTLHRRESIFFFPILSKHFFFFTAKIYARKSGFTYTIRRYSTLTEIVFLFLSFFLSCFNQDTFCYFKTNSRKKCFKPRQKPQSKLSPQNSTSGHATIKRLPKRKAEALTMSLYSFLRRGIV